MELLGHGAVVALAGGHDEAGAANVEIQIDCNNNSAADDANNSIFLEARVTATACGLPRIRAQLP